MGVASESCTLSAALRLESHPRRSYRYDCGGIQRRALHIAHISHVVWG